jgi:hypothetical protein
MYMLGCPLQAAYPVVPLADHHVVSVGLLTVNDQACFGVYVDRQALPDADMLARDIDGAITELLASTQQVNESVGSLLMRAHAATPDGPQSHRANSAAVSYTTPPNGVTSQTSVYHGDVPHSASPPPAAPPAPVPPRPQPVEAPLANTQPIEAPVANGFAGEPRSPGL